MTFSQEAKDKYDGIGKAAAEALFKDIGARYQRGEEVEGGSEYTVDFIVNGYPVDAEVKAEWGRYFTFPRVPTANLSIDIN